MLFVIVLTGILCSNVVAQSTTSTAKTKTLQDVLAMLKVAEGKFNKLVDESSQLDRNITKLEHNTAKTMDNETNVSTHLLQLEFTTKWNNKTLNHLAYWTTQLKEGMDFERYDLSTSDKAKKDTTTAAKTLAAKANATVTKANLTMLEEIGTKLWRVSNPQSSNSLDKTEARLKAMDTEIKYVRDKLDPVIKESMKTKLRRNMDRWRKDNLELGMTALKRDGELSKYYLTGDEAATDDPNAAQWPLDNDGTDVGGDEWFLQVRSKKAKRGTGN